MMLVMVVVVLQAQLVKVIQVVEKEVLDLWRHLEDLVVVELVARLQLKQQVELQILEVVVELLVLLVVVI